MIYRNKIKFLKTNQITLSAARRPLQQNDGRGRVCSYDACVHAPFSGRRHIIGHIKQADSQPSDNQFRNTCLTTTSDTTLVFRGWRHLQSSIADGNMNSDTMISSQTSRFERISLPLRTTNARGNTSVHVVKHNGGLRRRRPMFAQLTRYGKRRKTRKWKPRIGRRSRILYVYLETYDSIADLIMSLAVNAVATTAASRISHNADSFDGPECDGSMHFLATPLRNHPFIHRCRLQEVHCMKSFI